MGGGGGGGGSGRVQLRLVEGVELGRVELS